jgi:plastocyanin
MQTMRRFAVVLLIGLVGLEGCHLADSPDAVKCDPGTHPSDGHCAVDAVSAVRVMIVTGEGGASCSVEPDSVKVAANAKFEFQNLDSVEHVIAGADGKAWATAQAGQLSPLIGITKAGSWAYTVSGCTKGGTVVVE